MSKPCGCEESRSIREFAELEGRMMAREEAKRALAADLQMTVAELERHLLNQRALQAWRRQHP